MTVLERDHEPMRTNMVHDWLKTVSKICLYTGHVSKMDPCKLKKRNTNLLINPEIVSRTD